MSTSPAPLSLSREIWIRNETARRDASRATTVVHALRTAENEIRAAYVAAETIEDQRDRADLLATLGTLSATVRHTRESVALGGYRAEDTAGECDRCECTGRITVVVDDAEGGYDGSAPCPDCR